MNRSREPDLRSSEAELEAPVSLIGWRFDLEAVAAERLQWKYADELNIVLLGCHDLNVAVERMHQAVRDASLPDLSYPALAMATLVLSTRLFHAARGTACLTANGHGAEARPLRRQSSEIVARAIDIFKDESGQRARAWLNGSVKSGPTKTVQSSFGKDGTTLYGWLSDDAHGNPGYLGLEVLRRLRDRDGVWAPLADPEEDRASLRLARNELVVLTESANTMTSRIENSAFGVLANLEEISSAWATDPSSNTDDKGAGK